LDGRASSRPGADGAPSRLTLPEFQALSISAIAVKGQHSQKRHQQQAEEPYWLGESHGMILQIVSLKVNAVPSKTNPAASSHGKTSL